VCGTGNKKDWKKKDIFDFINKFKNRVDARKFFVASFIHSTIVIEYLLSAQTLFRILGK
jgi:hypothetical protein